MYLIPSVRPAASHFPALPDLGPPPSVDSMVNVPTICLVGCQKSIIQMLVFKIPAASHFPALPDLGPPPSVDSMVNVPIICLVGYQKSIIQMYWVAGSTYGPLSEVHLVTCCSISLSTVYGINSTARPALEQEW